MPRNFNLDGLKGISLAGLREPHVMVRAGLGVLLAANLVVAAFAFHLIGDSPETLNQQLVTMRAQKLAAQTKLQKSRALTSNIEKGKGEGDKFLATYMTSRRYTSSIIIGELNLIAKEAGMSMLDGTIAPLEAIEGSADLDMMTISVNFEGGYHELVRLMNLLDRSKRFLIIESITVTPRPKNEQLAVNVRFNTFVKEDGDSVSQNVVPAKDGPL